MPITIKYKTFNKIYLNYLQDSGTFICFVDQKLSRLAGGVS